MAGGLRIHINGVKSVKNNKLISVIIPAYNAQQYIRQTIESVLSQSYKNIEIIVINDGSTDETPKIIECFGDRIRVIHQKNMGLSGARNNGIRAALGEFVAFVDADDLWAPDKIGKQVALFNKNPELGFAYTDYSIFGPGAGKEFHKISPKLYKGYVLKELFCYPFIIVSSVMVKKACLEEVGLFDTDNPSTQDYDLWMRLAERYTADFVDEPLVRYRVHSEAMSRDRAFMLHWVLYVIQKQLLRNPGIFKDFPIRLFLGTKSMFLRALILFAYRFIHQKDRKTAREMLRNYLQTYLRFLLHILFRKV